MYMKMTILWSFSYNFFLKGTILWSLSYNFFLKGTILWSLSNNLFLIFYGKKFGSHNMTMLYPNPCYCYNRVYYKGTVLCRQLNVLRVEM